MSGLKRKEDLSDERLYARFVKQLRKDFSQSGIDESFINGISRDYPALLKTISSVLTDLGHRRDLIARLLNRIDISETQLNQYLDKGQNYEETLAELIIKRTLQKAVYQMRFSGK